MMTWRFNETCYEVFPPLFKGVAKFRCPRVGLHFMERSPKALLDAVEQGTVARRDISAFTVRQIQALKDKSLNARLEKVWGAIRPASQEKAGLMAKYKALLTPDYLKSADRSNGRLLYSRTC